MHVHPSEHIVKNGLPKGIKVCHSFAALGSECISLIKDIGDAALLIKIRNRHFESCKTLERN